MLRCSTPGHKPSPFVYASANTRLDAFKVSLVDHWPKCGFRVERISHFHCSVSITQGRDRLFITISGNENASLGGASLSAVNHRGFGQLRDNCGELCIGTDNRRRLTTELQSRSFDLGATNLGHPPAGDNTAGNTRHVDIGVRHQIFTGIAICCQNIDDTGRYRRLLNTLSEHV